MSTTSSFCDMRSTSERSLSGLSVATPMGIQRARIGSIAQASKLDRRVTLGMAHFLYDNSAETESSAVPSLLEMPSSTARGKELLHESPTSSTASLGSIDDDDDEFLYGENEKHEDHPIEEVIVPNQESRVLDPDFAPKQSVDEEQELRNIWVDHFAALVGTLIFCLVLFFSNSATFSGQ